MADAQEQRKLKPIYDALDAGSYKLAIQHCNKLLKKQPQHEVVRALKSLALLRGNKIEESITLCNEILASKPTDETVLGIISHVLKNIDRSAEIVGMFDDAFKKQPQNEELGAQAFMAMIRAGGFKNAQNTSFKMFKTFKDPKYLYWSIMAAVLQAQNSTADSVQHAPILLNLALRLITTSPVPSHVSPDYFHLHLTILKSLNLFKDAYELVTSPHGVQLCQLSLAVDELRREIFEAHGAHKEEATICRDRLETGDRNWLTLLALVNSTFKLIEQIESKPSAGESAEGTLQEAPAADSKDTDESDSDRTPKPSQELSFTESSDPQVLIDGLQELYARLAGNDGLADRGAHLAVLHLEKKIRTWRETKGTPLSPEFVSQLRQYFHDFADKACCFEDLKPYVSDLKESSAEDGTPELDSWLEYLREQESKKDLSSKKGLQRVINAVKLIRFSAVQVQDAELECQNAMTYLKYYFEALPLGKDLPDKELQPADDLAILSANALVSAWLISKKEPYIHQALVILEHAIQKSPHNYQFRVLAIRLYRLIGANGPAMEHYRILDTKQIQTDTLSHLILSRAATYSLAATGDLQMMTACVTASDIYTVNGTETADMIVRAFQYQKYSQITEFVEFEDRLENSIQRDLTRFDYTRMRFTHEKLDHDMLALELQELEFVREKMHYDNRDYTVIPNYQPRGQQLADQTSMGPVRGFQWLAAFLQLYIRAYSRASKTASPFATELDDFQDHWLSEFTDTEKQFLKFSQVLHEWVPCPPLEPREPASTDAKAQNGDANGKVEPPTPKEVPAFLKVDATPEAAVQFFADSLEQLKAALADGKLLWEAMHIAVIAQEGYLLLQAAAFPWLPVAGKAKKSEQPIVQSLKDVRSQAATHMRDIAQLLITHGENDSNAERRKAIIQGCSSLEAVDARLDSDYVLNIAKTLLDARKAVAEGVGKGILKIVNGS